MPKTRILAAATALAAGVAVSATSAQAADVTLWHAMGGKLGEAVNAIANDFNAKQNTCKLDAVFKGSYEETMTAGIAAFRADQAPNIIQIFDAGAATIINAPGAVLPVADLLEATEGGFDVNDYITGVRSFYADSSGKMIGMPFNSSTPVLYYNKAALEKAGVEPPKTWEEFEAIAPKLKDAGFIPFSQSHTPWIMSENFHSRHNIMLADENNGFDGLSSKINYNNEHMRMHFSKLKEWKDAGLYGYYGSKWADNRIPFEKEEVAMWLGSSGSFGDLKTTAQFDFGTTYLPFWSAVTNGQSFGTFIGGAALFAFSGHDGAENACVADFFTHLASAETQVTWHKDTGYVPITNAAYDLAKAQGYYTEAPDAEVGILQLKQQSADWNKGYRLGFYVQIREVMNREYDKFFNGQTTVEQAFQTIEEEANKLLERFGRTAG